jgi:RimJ/RimL family protein N-acetyltransferase
MKIIETERLYLRELTPADQENWGKVLSDPEAMKHYPHPLSTEEVTKWLEWTLDNYQKYKHGFWAVILKDGDIFIGDCGITMQNIDNEIVPEIGFHIIKDFWNQGYATEAAQACKEYAFNVLNYPRVFSYTTVENIPSQKVAQKIGMKVYKHFVRDGEELVVQFIEQDK